MAKVLELLLNGDLNDSANNNDGAMVGDATWEMLSTGKQVVKLSGAGYIGIPNSAALNNYIATKQLTIVIWFKPTMPEGNLLTTAYPLVHKMSNTAGGLGGGYRIPIQPDTINGILQPNIYINLSTTAGYDSIRCWAVPATNVWHCLIFTVDSYSKRTYINGILDRETVYTTPPVWLPNNENLYIGDEPNNYWYTTGFVGQIGHVSVYDNAISADEAITLYNSMASRFDETPTPPGTPPLPYNTKSLYIWDFILQMLQNSSEADRFLEVCEKEGVTLALAKIDGDEDKWFRNDTWYPSSAWEYLISKGKSKGITFFGVIGALVNDLSTPSNKQAKIQAVIKYNQEHPANPILGIEFDIEGLPPSEANAATLTTYIRTLKSYSYNGQTIVNQGLILGRYNDNGWDSDWAYKSAATLAYQMEYDYVSVPLYQDTYEAVLARLWGRHTYYESHGIWWYALLEVAEFGTPSEYTTYDEGPDVAHDIIDKFNAQIATYGLTKYLGFGLHSWCYVQRWHMITDIQWPTGSYKKGDTIPIPVTLRRSENYDENAFGVKVTFTSDAGESFNDSAVVVLKRIEAKQPTIEVPVPLTIAAGLYSMSVELWDLDFNESGYAFVYRSKLLTTGSYASIAEIEALSMEEIASLTRPGTRLPYAPLERINATARIQITEPNAGIPVAQFSANPSAGAPPLTVQFTDQSTSVEPITNWSWDFGDGNLSNIQDPIHTYSKAGDFIVTLIVSNSLGVSLPTILTIKVKKKDTGVANAMLMASAVGLVAIMKHKA